MVHKVCVKSLRRALRKQFFTLAVKKGELSMACYGDTVLNYHPFSGRVSVCLYGCPYDWSLAGEERDDVLERMKILAEEWDVQSILAPRPSRFNARICSPDDLLEDISLSSKSVLWRGCDADGVEIPPGQTFFLASADCVTIVAHDPYDGKTIAAHGGRDCLMDRGRINGEIPREFESVVHSIASRFSKRGIKRLKVFMTCGIGPEHFDHPCNHPQYGEKNMRMVLDVLARYGSTCLYGDHFQGKICLSEVIRTQFLQLGVQPYNIGFDTVDTFEDKDPTGDYWWWSYRRGDGKKRNGVFVSRLW